MASLINADNGVVSGSSGVKTTADTSGVLALQSNGTTGLTLGTDLSVTVVGAGSIQGLTVGRGAGAVATNTAVGASALAANTSGGNNTSVGSQSLLLNTTGTGATAIGRNSMQNNDSGTDSTAVGRNSLFSNTTGSNNVAIGKDSLYLNTTASNNTAVGYQAGYTSTGQRNAFFGSEAGYANTTGESNTYIGRQAGNLMTSGNNNTIIGRYNGNQGGLDIRTASNYIVLSDGDGNPRGIFDSAGRFFLGQTGAGFSNSNSMAFQPPEGYSVLNHITGTGSGTNYIWFGYAGGSIGTISQNGTTAVSYNTTSDYRLKNSVAPMTGALAKVALLKPVTYKWNADGSDGQGFIAHELAEVCPDAVCGAKDAVHADGNPQYQGIDTSFLVATLTAAIQELKAEFDAYKSSHP